MDKTKDREERRRKKYGTQTTKKPTSLLFLFSRNISYKIEFIANCRVTCKNLQFHEKLCRILLLCIVIAHKNSLFHLFMTHSNIVFMQLFKKSINTH